MSSFTELAEHILSSAKQIDAYTNSQNVPRGDLLKDLPADVEDARQAIIDSTQALKRRALGPIGTLMETLYTVSISF